MSDIQSIIDRCEQQADRGHMLSEYSEHIHLLKALDVLADHLDRIAAALEDRNTDEAAKAWRPKP